MATVTMHGKTVKTLALLPALGIHAPDFSLTNLELKDVHLRDFHGQKVVLNIFPSLDTAVCATGVRHFNQLAEKMPNLIVLCISADLPFAQKRFCGAEGLKKVIPLSTFRHPEFGKSYGVVLVDGPMAGLMSRAVVLIDENGKVTYSEQVAELSSEPNYEAALASLKESA